MAETHGEVSFYRKQGRCCMLPNVDLACYVISRAKDLSGKCATKWRIEHGCPLVRRANLRALASGLSTV